MKAIPLGNTAIIKAEVENTETGEAIDPSEDLFRILRPDGKLAEPSVEHPKAGLYLCAYDPEETGVHKLVFIGKGENKVVGPGAFRVTDPGVPIT